MSNGSGLNTNEVREALEAARAAGSMEDVRYLERVLAHRGERLADLSSHEIVAGNPEAYPKTTVEEQEDLAIGRPHEPVKAEDLGLRGSVSADVGTTSADDGPKRSTRK